MTRHWCLAATFAATFVCMGSALAAPQTTSQAPPGPPGPPGPTAEAAVPPDAEVAPAAETPDQTAYLDQVVCQRVSRAASRLPSRRQVCDTRRAWRDMEEEAVRETQRLLNANATNNRERQPGR